MRTGAEYRQQQQQEEESRLSIQATRVFIVREALSHYNQAIYTLAIYANNWNYAHIYTIYTIHKFLRLKWFAFEVSIVRERARARIRCDFSWNARAVAVAVDVDVCVALTMASLLYTGYRSFLPELKRT